MKIYIAYKYQKHSNKAQLQSELSQLAEVFEKNGNSTFILGRDVQKWDNSGHFNLSTVKEIINNIRNYDTLFVYNDTDVKSIGLPMEILLAKIFGLKIFYATKLGAKSRFFEFLADDKLQFDTFADLKVKAGVLLTS